MSATVNFINRNGRVIPLISLNVLEYPWEMSCWKRPTTEQKEWGRMQDFEENTFYLLLLYLYVNTYLDTFFLFLVNSNYTRDIVWLFMYTMCDDQTTVISIHHFFIFRRFTILSTSCLEILNWLVTTVNILFYRTLKVTAPIQLHPCTLLSAPLLPPQLF